MIVFSRLCSGIKEENILPYIKSQMPGHCFTLKSISEKQKDIGDYYMICQFVNKVSLKDAVLELTLSEVEYTFSVSFYKNLAERLQELILEERFSVGDFITLQRPTITILNNHVHIKMGEGKKQWAVIWKATSLFYVEPFFKPLTHLKGYRHLVFYDVDHTGSRDHVMSNLWSIAMAHGPVKPLSHIAGRPTTSKCVALASIVRLVSPLSEFGNTTRNRDRDIAVQIKFNEIVLQSKPQILTTFTAFFFGELAAEIDKALNTKDIIPGDLVVLINPCFKTKTAAPINVNFPPDDKINLLVLSNRYHTKEVGSKLCISEIIPKFTNEKHKIDSDLGDYLPIEYSFVQNCFGGDSPIFKICNELAKYGKITMLSDIQEDRLQPLKGGIIMSYFLKVIVASSKHNKVTVFLREIYSNCKYGVYLKLILLQKFAHSFIVALKNKNIVQGDIICLVNPVVSQNYKYIANTNKTCVPYIVQLAISEKQKMLVYKLKEIGEAEGINIDSKQTKLMENQESKNLDNPPECSQTIVAMDCDNSVMAKTISKVKFLDSTNIPVKKSLTKNVAVEAKQTKLMENQESKNLDNPPECSQTIVAMDCDSSVMAKTISTVKFLDSTNFPVKKSLTKSVAVVTEKTNNTNNILSLFVPKTKANDIVNQTENNNKQNPLQQHNQNSFLSPRRKCRPCYKFTSNGEEKKFRLIVTEPNKHYVKTNTITKSDKNHKHKQTISDGFAQFIKHIKLNRFNGQSKSYTQTKKGMDPLITTHAEFEINHTTKRSTESDNPLPVRFSDKSSVSPPQIIIDPRLIPEEFVFNSQCTDKELNDGFSTTHAEFEKNHTTKRSTESDNLLPVRFSDKSSVSPPQVIIDPRLIPEEFVFNTQCTDKELNDGFSTTHAEFEKNHTTKRSTESDNPLPVRFSDKSSVSPPQVIIDPRLIPEEFVFNSQCTDKELNDGFSTVTQTIKVTSPITSEHTEFKTNCTRKRCKTEPDNFLSVRFFDENHTNSYLSINRNIHTDEELKDGFSAESFSLLPVVVTKPDLSSSVDLVSGYCIFNCEQMFPYTSTVQVPGDFSKRLCPKCLKELKLDFCLEMLAVGLDKLIKVVLHGVIAEKYLNSTYEQFLVNNEACRELVVEQLKEKLKQNQITGDGFKIESKDVIFWDFHSQLQ